MRGKRRQTQAYQLGTTAPNRVPTWTVQGTKRTLTRSTVEARSSALEALDAEIIEKLAREIQISIDNNKDLENLKDLINADKAGVSYRDMDRVAVSLKKTEKTIDRYHRIVNESFYEIVNRLRAVAEAVVKSQQSESAEHAKIPMDEDEQRITEREAEGLNITKDKRITIITWSLNKLLRAELENDIRQAFKGTCRQTMASLSNYINEYSFSLYRLIMSLRTSTFTRLSDGFIDLQQRTGINVERILPEGFQNTIAIGAFPLPIDRQCLEAEENDWQEMVESFLMRSAADDQQKEQIQTMETELANLVTNLASTYIERNEVVYALADLERTLQQRQAGEDEINNQIRMTKSNKRHIL
ncbi:MAG: hypothetical protein EXX96DRAFT_626502 [Benjaminiella poitrasii]|nr:MAG: hypothetical protein EXX96DRAFT_626502 [Benjaminiella poitrasii]